MAGAGNLEQVWAFPYRPGPADGAEAAGQLPVHQVGCGVDQDASLDRLDRGQHPPAGLGMPEDLRIAEAFRAPGQDRIARVLLPGTPFVCAEGERLGLLTRTNRVLRGIGAGVDGDQGAFGAIAETGGVVPVPDDTAGEDLFIGCSRDGGRQFLPSMQVGGDGMTPGDVRAVAAERIVLKEQVV